MIARVCACTESGFVEIWSGRLLITNLASVAGLKTTKTYACLCVRQPDTSGSTSPFLRSDRSKAIGRLKARFRPAYMTPQAPSVQLRQPGVGKHSRLAAADVKLLTLSKGQANWNIDQRNIWISGVLRHFISPKIDRRCQMRYVEWKSEQECKQRQPWSSISVPPQYGRSSALWETFYERLISSTVLSPISIKKVITRFCRRLVIPGMGNDISLEVFDGASQAETHK